MKKMIKLQTEILANVPDDMTKEDYQHWVRLTTSLYVIRVAEKLTEVEAF